MRHAPARSVEAEGHQVDSAHAGGGVEALALGQVADLWPWACWGERPSTSTDPPASGTRPRIAFISVDLPAPLGPSTATNSPRPMVSETSERIVAAADADRGVAEGDGGCAEDGVMVGVGHRPVAWCRAAWRVVSCATCHCWKESDAGDSVSVTVTIGMWAARASRLSRSISGVTFWEL